MPHGSASPGFCFWLRAPWDTLSGTVPASVLEVSSDWGRLVTSSDLTVPHLLRPLSPSLYLSYVLRLLLRKPSAKGSFSPRLGLWHPVCPELSLGHRQQYLHQYPALVCLRPCLSMLYIFSCVLQAAETVGVIVLQSTRLEKLKPLAWVSEEESAPNPASTFGPCLDLLPSPDWQPTGGSSGHVSCLLGAWDKQSTQ